MHPSLIKLVLLLFCSSLSLGLRYVPPGNDSLIGYLDRAAQAGNGSNPIESVILGTAAEKFSRNCANEDLQSIVPCFQWLEGTVGALVFNTTVVNETVNRNLENPGYFGSTNTKAFFIECGAPFLTAGCVEGTKLLAWLIEPATAYNDVTILYMHGVGDTVAQGNRIGTYNTLRMAGYRVLTFDYRGFGISSRVDAINEMSTVEDALLVMNWLEDNLKTGEKYVVWGHSFGAAIAIQAVSRKNGSSSLASLVLESAFNNLRAAFDYLTESYIPALQGIVQGISRVDSIFDRFKFLSDETIRTLNIPILMLHSEDDPKVPIELGRKLFQSAKAAGRAVSMLEFPANQGYDHELLYTNPDLPQIINNFVFP